MIRQFLPRSLFGRSLMIIVVPVILLQIILAIVFLDRHWSRVAGRLSAAFVGEVHMIARMIKNDPSEENLRYLSRLTHDHLDFEIQLMRDTLLPRIVPGNLSLRHLLITETVLKDLNAIFDEPLYLAADPREKWINLVIQLDIGDLVVNFPEGRLFTSSSYIFLLWMMGTSLVLFVIAIIFMRNQIRPIRKLAIVAERFGKGQDIPARYKPEGAREVRQASQAFLDMRRRIQRQIDQRTSMLAGISHDLRTPLTRMKLQLSMMPECDDTAAMKDDIEWMEKMVHAYIEFVRGSGAELSEYSYVSDLLKQALEADGLTNIKLDILSETPISVRPVALTRAFKNIIRNARRHADAFEIGVEYDDTESGMVVTIDDNGPGIAPEQYDDVFKPFYRIESSRNPDLAGIGLGLAITQDIIHSHGGEITLDKSPMGGLRVIIRLPV